MSYRYHRYHGHHRHRRYRRKHRHSTLRGIARNVRKVGKAAYVVTRFSLSFAKAFVREGIRAARRH